MLGGTEAATARHAVSVYRACIIEDDDGWARSIRKELEIAGFSVDYDPDVAEGVGLAQRGRYDLVVIDKQLSWTKTGVEVIDDIRSFDSRVCLVLASAHTNTVDEERTLTNCRAQKCDKGVQWAVQLRSVARQVLKGEPRGVHSSSSSRIGVELGSRLKKTFIEYLDSFPDPDSPKLAVGDKLYSVSQLKREVAQETDLGVLLVDLFLKERLLD